MTIMTPRARTFLSVMATTAVVMMVTTTFAFSTNHQQRVFVSTPSKPIQKLVEEYMVPIALTRTLHIHDSVEDAIEKLILSGGVTGAPVINDKQELVGFVSILDILPKEAAGGGALLPVIMDQDGKHHYFTQVKAARKIIATQVEDLMTTDVMTIESKDTLQAAASIMTEHGLHCLPVVNAGGKLIGTLASLDVMRDVIQKVRALTSSSFDADGDSIDVGSVVSEMDDPSPELTP
eukprot:CAMPEP_0119545320 /NCGR_PEP_ID=MMETSP1352-20130426/94_1 /TAXON_ID=265584 /ORGANISM="Stauroneis constricta, Strain CCMP1120" /LENGTH=234 /DNA_ID=CAMNT_0007589853 /DNA_START=140 /DNA_END=844 /DNA_ORIENTATION=-